MFKTQFDGHPRKHANPGDSEHVLYTSKIEKDGTISLVESGREDIYDQIQSHKDSCDIHVLLARYKNGEADVLSQRQGSYGDFTEMPKTYADILNAMIAGETYFNSLPVETRAKFDHSLEKFMASMDDMPSFFEKLGVTPLKQQDSGPEGPSMTAKEVESVEPQH